MQVQVQVHVNENLYVSPCTCTYLDPTLLCVNIFLLFMIFFILDASLPYCAFIFRYGDSRRGWDSGPREMVGSGGYGGRNMGYDVPMDDGAMGGGSSDLLDSLSHLSHMSDKRSKLALNILNAVLSKVRVCFLFFKL